MANMNTKLGTKIFRINQFFSRPIGIITAIGLMALFIFIYFALDNKALLRQLKELAETNRALNLRLEQVVTDIKEDNARQTDLIVCLLAVHSEANIITEIDEATCERVVAENDQLSRINGGPPPAQNDQPNSPSKKPRKNPPKNPPNNPPNPPNPPEPPESILPFVDEPLVGCRLGVCL